MDQVSVLKTFKDQMVSLLDELTNIFERDTELYEYRVLITTVPSTDLITHFKRDVLPYKEYVQKRNPEFFSQRVSFGTQEVSDKLCDLWHSAELETDDREMIWNYFDVLFQLAEMY